MVRQSQELLDRVRQAISARRTRPVRARQAVMARKAGRARWGQSQPCREKQCKAGPGRARQAGRAKQVGLLQEVPGRDKQADLGRPKQPVLGRSKQAGTDRAGSQG